MSRLSERVTYLTGSRHGVGRVGEPEDIAAAIALLVRISGDAVWIPASPCRSIVG